MGIATRWRRPQWGAVGPLAQAPPHQLWMLVAWMCVSTTTALWGLSSLPTDFRATSPTQFPSLQTSQVKYFSKCKKCIIFNVRILLPAVVNRSIVTINQVDPLIEWVQVDNPLYPTCITGYVIADQLTRRSTIVSSTTRSLTAQQLNAAGFPYCTTIHPTVTPITPMGPLMTVQGSNALYTSLIDPGKLLHMLPIPNNIMLLAMQIFQSQYLLLILLLLSTM